MSEIDYSENKSKFLIEEYKTAWSHYRHLERLRNQYLGFLFAAIFAGIGLIPRILLEESMDFRIQIAFTMTTLTIFLNTTIYFNVKKIGTLLSHYSDVYRIIRLQFYNNRDYLDLKNLFDIRERKHVFLKFKFLGFRTIIKYSLGYILPFFLFIALFKIINWEELSYNQYFVFNLFLFLLLGYHLITLRIGNDELKFAYKEIEKERFTELIDKEKDIFKTIDRIVRKENIEFVIFIFFIIFLICSFTIIYIDSYK